MSATFFKSIRAKLIGIFVLIKVIPLIALAFSAWQAATQLGTNVTLRSTDMADGMLETIRTVGDSVIKDSTSALDSRSREAIERLTTDTARGVTHFIYDRDRDILQAASLEPSEAAYGSFLAIRQRQLYLHGDWQLSDHEKNWIPVNNQQDSQAKDVTVQADLAANSKGFHARAKQYIGQPEWRPLYREITLVGLNGKEQLKVTSNNQADSQLAVISDRMQTFAKAETYWPE